MIVRALFGDAVTPVMGHARCNVSIASGYREGMEMIWEINPKACPKERCPAACTQGYVKSRTG